MILRVSEARDLGELDRLGFYDHMKVYTAAPPDVLRVDEKNLREYAVVNCVGVIHPRTTRRMASTCPQMTAATLVAGLISARTISIPTTGTGYTAGIVWRRSSCSRLSCYNFDLGTLDAKAPPPKTPAFWEIVDASRAPEDAELADAVDALGSPDALSRWDRSPPVLPVTSPFGSATARTPAASPTALKLVNMLPSETMAPRMAC